jgi:DNA-directed RNA polymerase subunit RPC12/RpoP
MSKDRNKCEVTEIERMAGEIERIFAEAEMRQTVTKKHPSILKAEALYNAGYRKQSVGEWVRQEKEKGKVTPEAVCSNCGRDVEYQVIDGRWAFENYCPHCGSRNRGEENEQRED